MATEDFFLRDNVTRVCPETKRVKKSFSDPAENILCIITDQQFAHFTKKLIAESSDDYSFSYFSRHCPYFVETPNPNDWRTCLSKTYLNPEIKLKFLARTFKVNWFKWNDSHDYINLNDLIGNTENVKCDNSIKLF